MGLSLFGPPWAMLYGYMLDKDKDKDITDIW